MQKPVVLVVTCFFETLSIAVLFSLSMVSAALVTLPSGEDVDLSRNQIEQIKIQPGIFYVQYPKQSMISSEMKDSVIIEIPATLGGGFLIGLEKDIQQTLAIVRNQGGDPGTGSEPPSSSLNKDRKKGGPHSRFRAGFTLAGEYRTDALDWNIAGNSSGTAPNILSELTWEDLTTFQLRLASRSVILNHFFLKADFNYGWIFEGHNQDSDYAFDDRAGEFSRSNNQADRGEVWDASIGVGPRFTFGLPYLELIPLVGYSRHEQHLTITDGYQSIPAMGAFEGLYSTYAAQWQGPWVGFDLTIRAGRPLGIFSDVGFLFDFEYHRGDYYAEAEWNLRSDLAHPKSFEHEADGHGYHFSFSSEFYFDAHWALACGYRYVVWETDPGLDRVFISGGGTAKTRLNEVNWRSKTISIGARYQF